MSRFLTWLNARNLVGIRAFMLYMTCWMTWAAFDWAGVYALAALAAGKVDVSVSAIIGAVTAPISFLAGFVFRVYADSKGYDV